MGNNELKIKTAKSKKRDEKILTVVWSQRLWKLGFQNASNCGKSRQKKKNLLFEFMGSQLWTEGETLEMFSRCEITL